MFGMKKRLASHKVINTMMTDSLYLRESLKKNIENCNLSDDYLDAEIESLRYSILKSSIAHSSLSEREKNSLDYMLILIWGIKFEKLFPESGAYLVERIETYEYIMSSSATTNYFEEIAEQFVLYVTGEECKDSFLSIGLGVIIASHIKASSVFLSELGKAFKIKG